jgi:hypothetical protein
MQEEHKPTLDSLGTVDAIASRLASQAGNAGEAAQSILARSTTSSRRAGVALIAAVASRTHRARGARNSRLLLQLLHFRRQSTCKSVMRGEDGEDEINKLILTDFILEVSDVTNAGVVVGGAVIRTRKNANCGDAVANKSDKRQ